jgi:uncharacterized protein (DUF2126 family)
MAPRAPLPPADLQARYAQRRRPTRAGSRALAAGTARRRDAASAHRRARAAPTGTGQPTPARARTRRVGPLDHAHRAVRRSARPAPRQRPKAEREHGGKSGLLYVFMPPLARLEDYLDLLAAVEATPQSWA